MAMSFSIRSLDRLVVESGLPMAREMFEMCPDDRRPLFYDSCHDGLSSYGTASRSITEIAPSGQVPIQAPRPSQKMSLTRRAFPSISRSAPFRAVRDALAAARAFLLIDTDDLPFHCRSPALDIIDQGIKLMDVFFDPVPDTVVAGVPGWVNTIYVCST